MDGLACPMTEPSRLLPPERWPQRTSRILAWVAGARLVRMADGGPVAGDARAIGLDPAGADGAAAVNGSVPMTVFMTGGTETDDPSGPFNLPSGVPASLRITGLPL